MPFWVGMRTGTLTLCLEWSCFFESAALPMVPASMPGMEPDSAAGSEALVSTTMSATSGIIIIRRWLLVIFIPVEGPD